MERRNLLCAGLVAGGILAGSANAQVLDLGVTASPVGLDPHVATAFSSAMITNNLYEGLTAVAADLSVIPALASGWTVSEDGLTYRFDLRGGVTFHDGTAFGADDVIASLDRVLAEETGSPVASRYALVAEATAVDDLTVEIVLSEPFAPFLGELSVLAIVSKDYLDGGGDLQSGAAGTGPFSLGETIPETWIQLDAHPDYWEDGLPRVEALKFHIIPEPATLQIGLRTGTLDMIPAADVTSVATLEATEGIEVLSTQELGYSLVGLNVSEPPFDNPLVREALNYALDRRQIVDAALLGRGVPAGPLSPALSGWAQDISAYPCYATDPDRARELLAEAGYPDGVSFTLKALGILPQIVDFSQVVQAQLNNAGFEVELVIQERGEFVQDWLNSNFQAFASLNSGSIDPDGTFFRTFTTDGSTNVFKYSDAAVDAALTAARSSVSGEERRALYNQVQDILACSGPILFIAYADLHALTGAGVSGFDLIANRNLRSLRATEVTE